MRRALHVFCALALMVFGAALAVRFASSFPLTLKLPDIVAPIAGAVGAWCGWCCAGSPTLAVPLQARRASWAALADRGCVRGGGCALGAVRRHAWEPLQTLSHERGHRLVLGTGIEADDAFIAAASRWRGALVFVDTRGLSERLSRDDVVRFAPGRSDGLRLNPLLNIRGGAHAWRDACVLAAGLIGEGESAGVATLATVLLDHLYTAAPSERTLDGVRRRLLDPDRTLSSILAGVHEQGEDHAWRAHPEIARMARVWRSDGAAARMRLVEAERALRVLQDGRLANATSALDLVLADVACVGPKTVLVEAPPGDGARYGPFFAALLGQLVAHLTDALDTDAYGRTKTRPVLLAIDEARALGAVPLLAQRAGVAPRCGLELLVRADTSADANAIFGSTTDLSAFDAVVGVGPQRAATSAMLRARAGPHRVVRLRRQAGRAFWRRFAPTLEVASAPDRRADDLQRAARHRLTVLIAGLKPVRAVASAKVKASLRLRTEALTTPVHDWTAPAAPSPTDRRSLPASARPSARALPLFETQFVEPQDLSEEGGHTPASQGLDASRIAQRLRVGLARGSKSKVR